MAMFINTNVASLNARRNLEKSTVSLGKTFNRLASGLRINSAADDAAGMAITNRMTAQIRGLNQSQRNANDGISLVQVAEGALEETSSSLQRMRELAIQASNDIYTSSDRSSLQKEVLQLLSEIQRISTQTQFNGLKLLTGSFDGKIFQVGAFSGQTINVSIGTTSLGALGLSGPTGPIDISTYGTASTAIWAIDNALNSITDIRADLGAIQNRFESTIANLANVVENMSSARMRIQDADLAEETSRLTKTSILQQAGTAILAQANQQPQLALQLLG
ncbi:MAG: flagellin FliC [Magnetococcales bacterium]|nr:flagellin FliC [Magnetococcales bacterium]NGZ25982.1 flagellin FliC [Magnetococcales bacterium]